MSLSCPARMTINCPYSLFARVGGVHFDGRRLHLLRATVHIHELFKTLAPVC